MARTGRPRLENPRSEGVFMRLTKEEHAEIVEYAKKHNLTITQTLVQRIINNCYIKPMPLPLH